MALVGPGMAKPVLTCTQHKCHLLIRINEGAIIDGTVKETPNLVKAVTFAWNKRFLGQLLNSYLNVLRKKLVRAKSEWSSSKASTVSLSTPLWNPKRRDSARWLHKGEKIQPALVTKVSSTANLPAPRCSSFLWVERWEATESVFNW